MQEIGESTGLGQMRLMIVSTDSILRCDHEDVPGRVVLLSRVFRYNGSPARELLKMNLRETRQRWFSVYFLTRPVGSLARVGTFTIS